jgi:hypothetical protein
MPDFERAELLLLLSASHQPDFLERSILDIPTPPHA